MLTPRGWWFLILVLIVGAIGGILAIGGIHTNRQPPAPALWLASVAMAVWFGVEWARFTWQSRIHAPRLQLQRVIHRNGELVRTLWAGQTYEADVTVRLNRGKINYARCDDRSPVGAAMTGTTNSEGPIDSVHEIKWNCQFRPEHAGVVRFEGVAVRMSDLQGFFYHEQFIRAPLELVTLSPTSMSGRSRRTDKRENTLPPPGVHRFRRPGTGSELLELRDYRPGDPPRKIAWKQSSRREQLITREYESEVPLRCTLFLDASNATRIGPPGRTTLAGLADIAAIVTGTAISNRDLIGLAITTERSTDYSAPARTSARLVQIYQSLARASALPPGATDQPVRLLLAESIATANDFYPDLMRSEINRFPWWLAWLSPPPVYVLRKGKNPKSSIFVRWARVLSMTRRRSLTDRKRLAALLTTKYRLPPGAIALLTEDDTAFSRWIQHFLAEHRIPAHLKTFDHFGRDVFCDAAPLGQQAKALLNAISRGRDNELMVLMGEYVERADQLTPLLDAVRVARARHHQVMLVQPGPAPTKLPPLPENAGLVDLLHFAEQSRRARLWQVARRAFGRMGVPIVSAAEGDPASLILHRLEQIRSAEGARRI